MKYDQVDGIIFRVSEDKGLYFTKKGDAIKADLDNCSREEILDHLDYVGVIPESFSHDSTEEKLYAKYCDILLARALTELGYQAEAIEARGGAADIEAVGGGYTLVGDGKAFRLSRTAKNQKDFKVEALSQWKGDAEYAILVCPGYQYPNTKSQIYAQAIRYNVCMLSYTHLAFLVRSGNVGPEELESLWDLSRHLRSGQAAPDYWKAILDKIVELTGKTPLDWNEEAKDENARIAEQARQQIAFWEEKKRKIRRLDHDTVTEMLIDALKIDGKIETITKTAGLETGS